MRLQIEEDVYRKKVYSYLRSNNIDFTLLCGSSDKLPTNFTVMLFIMFELGIDIKKIIWNNGFFDILCNNLYSTPNDDKEHMLELYLKNSMIDSEFHFSKNRIIVNDYMDTKVALNIPFVLLNLADHTENLKFNSNKEWSDLYAKYKSSIVSNNFFIVDEVAESMLNTLSYLLTSQFFEVRYDEMLAKYEDTCFKVQETEQRLLMFQRQKEKEYKLINDFYKKEAMAGYDRFDKMYKYAKKNPHIKDIIINRKGMAFIIETTLSNYQTEQYKRNTNKLDKGIYRSIPESKKPLVKKVLDLIFLEKKYLFPIFGAINLENDSTYHNMEIQKNVYNQNYHIAKYTCFGSFAPILSEALQTQDYETFLMYIDMAYSNINWDDIVVVHSFITDIWEHRAEVKLIDKENNNEITLADLVQKIQKEEKDEQSVKLESINRAS